MSAGCTSLSKRHLKTLQAVPSRENLRPLCTARKLCVIALRMYTWLTWRRLLPCVQDGAATGL